MSVFSTVVCGVDTSPEGELAAGLAARVAAPDGELVLVSVADTSVPVLAGHAAGEVLETIDAGAREALKRGRAATPALHPATATVRSGNRARSVLRELVGRSATLGVAGMHHRSRAAGIVTGDVSTFLLHEAPCSVLIARPPAGHARWPRSVVVGLDGSDESASALIAARELELRFGSTIRTVIARGGDPFFACARLTDPTVEEHDGDPIDVLTRLSKDTDLVVVGSRGLRGLRALGSVSERVAHQACSSVLVVRGRGAPDPYVRSAGD